MTLSFATVPSSVASANFATIMVLKAEVLFFFPHGTFNSTNSTISQSPRSLLLQLMAVFQFDPIASFMKHGVMVYMANTFVKASHRASARLQVKRVARLFLL